MKRFLIAVAGFAAAFAPWMTAQAGSAKAGHRTPRADACTCGYEYRYERPKPKKTWLRWTDEKGQTRWSVGAAPGEPPNQQPDDDPAVVTDIPLYR